jgi:hypothetical protein
MKIASKPRPIRPQIVSPNALSIDLNGEISPTGRAPAPLHSKANRDRPLCGGLYGWQLARANHNSPQCRHRHATFVVQHLPIESYDEYRP